MTIAFKAAALLLGVLALAACGSSTSTSHSADRSRTTAAQPPSKAAYSAELQQVGTRLVTALNSFGKKFSGFKRVETSVGRGQAALNGAAARLAATTPPADARADNAKLASGLRDFAAQLTKLRTAAAHHNLQSVVAADRSLDRSPAVKAMMAAAADLQRKGYKLGQLAPSGKD
jgi:ABC-type glycerol-3-phosphate transport system substrate-binding protein